MNPLCWYDPEDPYPESDGEPMAENTEQWDWLVKIKENLEVIFAADPNVFVAGNLLWYPHPERRVCGPIGPDVMVVFGRPKGRRGCYKQWEEEGIGPQVVFEILSPANSARQMADKQAFYDANGVEEYYVYDPAGNTLEIWLRQGAPDGGPARLKRLSHLKQWTSPRLRIRFSLTADTLLLFDPDGKPFLNTLERDAEARAAAWEAKRATALAAERAAALAAAEARAAAAEVTAAEERARAERLAARLRELGLEP